MKTRAIIEFKDTYASMECHELGYQTKETALAIISPTGHILSSTPLFRKAYGSNTAHIDQLPFNIDDLSITLRGLSKKAKANLEDWIAHTIILPMDYDKYFTKHQELLHLLNPDMHEYIYTSNTTSELSERLKDYYRHSERFWIFFSIARTDT